MSGTEMTTVVRQKMLDRILVAAGFPALGAVAGWLLKLLANWADSWPWIPWEGPVELINNAPEPTVTIVLMVIGALAGGVIVLMAEHGYVTVTIEDNQVTTARGHSGQSVPRTAVNAVFADGKRLVVLGKRGEELAVENKNEGAGVEPLVSCRIEAGGFSRSLKRCFGFSVARGRSGGFAFDRGV
ncbi:hypothetical protein ACFWNT_43210 [Streptomyces sp. NPDC058409]|uniref:YqeB family protein n=1 Tax=Streptomyces sp. NPDC058409 TaxID=3346484 RepID=UPI0036663D01